MPRRQGRSCVAARKEEIAACDTPHATPHTANHKQFKNKTEPESEKCDVLSHVGRFTCAFLGRGPLHSRGVHAILTFMTRRRQVTTHTQAAKQHRFGRKFQLWMDDEFDRQLEELIRREVDLPSRSEMLRRLVVRASNGKGREKGS